MYFLESNNQIESEQHRFRVGESVTTAAIKPIQKIFHKLLIYIGTKVIVIFEVIKIIN